MQTLEMQCFRRLLKITCKYDVTNEKVRNKMQDAIGKYDDPLSIVKKRKLRWCDHTSRASGMAKTILQGTVKGTKRTAHYVNVSVLIKFSQKTSVFTLIIISSP